MKDVGFIREDNVQWCSAQSEQFCNQIFSEKHILSFLSLAVIS